VKLGFADPRFDAVGYRTLMALKLAEKKYSEQGLLYHLMNKQFTFPILQNSDSGVSVIRVPEILETTPDAHIVLRGASIQAIALLESGDIDYAFEYESVIKQHNLEMIPLADEINLGNPDFRENYQGVEVNMDFQRFATVVPDFVGDVISYGITIPANAPDPTEAAEFINFVLGPEGNAIMKSYYHPLLDSIVPDHCELMPQSLQSYCKK
jgi:molybdate/tungstate transport system substrate-binding protein